MKQTRPREQTQVVHDEKDLAGVTDDAWTKAGQAVFSSEKREHLLNSYVTSADPAWVPVWKALGHSMW